MDQNVEEAWHYPSNLERVQKEFQAVGVDQLDLGNDFGSYRKVLLTGETQDSLLELHNDLAPFQKLRDLDRLLGKPRPTSILDVGCGIGVTTRGLAHLYPDADVLGVDVSEDAISYARMTHSEVEFVALAIHPRGEEIGLFDLIYCFEFYPFTRTNDYEWQADFIDYLTKQLATSGSLIIYQLWDNPTSLSTVVDKVKSRLPQCDFHLHELPNPRFTARLPWFAARIFTRLLEIPLRRRLARTVLLIQRRDMG